MSHAGERGAGHVQGQQGACGGASCGRGVWLAPDNSCVPRCCLPSPLRPLGPAFLPCHPRVRPCARAQTARVKSAFATIYFLLYVFVVLLLGLSVLLASVVYVYSTGYAASEKTWRLRWASYVLRCARARVGRDARACVCVCVCGCVCVCVRPGVWVSGWVSG